MKRLLSQVLYGLIWLCSIISLGAYFVGVFCEFHTAMAFLSVAVGGMMCAFLLMLWRDYLGE